MQSLKRMLRRRMFAWLLLIVVSLPLTGCFGRFPLTRAIYDANASVGGEVGSDRTQVKLAQTAVMWVFVIIPVYEIGMIGDALVFNAIEFWTGNPVRIGQAETGAALAQHQAIPVKVVEVSR